ncbi:hypothetical protein PYW07_000526 [Mythimna separata]|uniref:Amino acid transporter transmembrane domain-containing protein n=1 Tax=Mythimna separata TaxID=271217 RepID=A0AAD7Z3T3_MYTSE|nr:hypothetical protein PYW07_000526 [Mythimna separata]
MFVYEYVQKGWDDVITALSDIEEDFDPHKYRKIPHPTTYAETMIHMLKGCLGAGLLAMPNAVSRVGIVFGVLGIAGIGFFATYCIQVLVLAQYQLCKKERRGYMAYTKSMRFAVSKGPKILRPTTTLFASLVDFFIFFWQIGICAIYFVFFAENIKQVYDFYSAPGVTISVRLLICYGYPVALAMSMIKNLKLLTPFSSISNMFLAVGLLLTFFYLIEEDVEIDESKMLAVNTIADIPVFIGITLFALEAVGVILALEYNMERPKEFTGWCGLFSIGMVIILGLYISLGVSGFLKYGKECKGSITLNLPQHEKKAQAVKIAFTVALFLSYPLQNFVAWQIAWRVLGKKFNKHPVADYVLRVIIATIPFGMAVAAPNLGAFMGLLGALCLTMVAVLFPAVMDICVYYPDGYGPFNYKLIVDIFIIIFGFFCCGSGVYTSLLEMYETSHD